PVWLQPPGCTRARDIPGEINTLPSPRTDSDRSRQPRLGVSSPWSSAPPTPPSQACASVSFYSESGVTTTSTDYDGTDGKEMRWDGSRGTACHGEARQERCRLPRTVHQGLSFHPSTKPMPRAQSANEVGCSRA